jgi:hypothetical protein
MTWAFERKLSPGGVAHATARFKTVTKKFKKYGYKI